MLPRLMLLLRDPTDGVARHSQATAAFGPPLPGCGGRQLLAPVGHAMIAEALARHLTTR